MTQRLKRNLPEATCVEPFLEDRALTNVLASLIFQRLLNREMAGLWPIPQD